MRSTYSRAAVVAVGLLASTVSATFNAVSSKNVAIYWGQGYDQIPLSEVCDDPSVDIVNIGFVNRFPQKSGDYPGTNFGMLADHYLKGRLLTDRDDSERVRF
jgi:chitinase